MKAESAKKTSLQKSSGQVGPKPFLIYQSEDGSSQRAATD
jgi:hypothetical protein